MAKAKQTKRPTRTALRGIEASLGEAKAHIKDQYAEIERLKDVKEKWHVALNDLEQAYDKLRRDLIHAAHLLGVAGEALSTRGATETARMCRAAAVNYAPSQVMTGTDNTARS